MQENIPIEEVFENLRCSKEGLSSEAAEERLVIFGHNKLEEKKVHTFTLLFSFSFFVQEISLCHLLNESHLKSLNFEVNYLSGCYSGEQVLEVLGVYVESSVLGYGGCCYNGNCTCQWRGELSKFSFGSF